MELPASRTDAPVFGIAADIRALAAVLAQLHAVLAGFAAGTLEGDVATAITLAADAVMAGCRMRLTTETLGAALNLAPPPARCPTPARGLRIVPRLPGN